MDPSIIAHARYPIPNTGRTVFFVAVFKYDDDPKKSRHRLWGWYSKFEDAEKAVLENHTDIFEHDYYDLACIEEMTEGVLSSAINVWWYKATYAPEFWKNPALYNPSVERIEPPAWTEGTCNFCIG